MRIHSSILSYADLKHARPDNVTVDIEHEGGSRKRGRGFTVYLYGSSPFWAQHDSSRHAATWDEHGIWMARLFDLDRDAIISWYDGYEDFIGQTNRVSKYYQQGMRHRRTHTAPWLSEHLHHPRTSRLPRTRNGRPNFELAARGERWTSPTDAVIDYWVERVQYGTPWGWNDHGECNSLSYEGDRFRHYNWTLANVTRKPNGALVCVNFPTLSEIHRWGSGGWGPSTSQRYHQLRRAVERAGIAITQDPETEPRFMDPDDVRNMVLHRRQLVSKTYRTITTKRVPVTHGVAELIMNALNANSERPLDFVDWDVKRATIGPIKDRRKIFIRQSVHKYVYANGYNGDALKRMKELVR